MKRTLIVVLTLALLAAMLTVASAATKTSVVKPGDDFVYLDKADVLSEATEGEIFFANRQLNAETGAMIVVVAMDSIGGADTYDYAYDLYNSWGIGGKENNGLLLLMAIEEDDYYALPGEGFEGVFSSSVLKTMMDQDLEPDFAKQNYDAGARKFFESAYKRLANYYNLDATIADAKAAYEEYRAKAVAGKSMNSGDEFADRGTRAETPKARPAQRGSSGGGSLLLILILILLLIICLRSKRRGGSFWFWRPTFFWPIAGSRTYPPNWQNPRRPRGPGGPTAPGGFGGMGTTGGFTGRTGGFGGTRTGGFTGRTGGFGGTGTTGGFTGRTGGFGGTGTTGGFTGRTGSTSSGRTTTRSTGSSSRSFGGFTGKLGGFGGGFSGGGGRSFGGGAGRGRH